MALLRSARASTDAGFDRLVFEFSSESAGGEGWGDSLPGYVVEYATRPIRRCGSGEEVSLAGTSRLVVRFQPARAHDDRGTPTIAGREWVPRLPVVQELKLVCDFEGQVEWAIGLASSRRFRVLELSQPARVVVDVRHRD